MAAVCCVFARAVSRFPFPFRSVSVDSFLSLRLSVFTMTIFSAESHPLHKSTHHNVFISSDS